MDVQSKGLKAVQSGMDHAARAATEVVQASHSGEDTVEPSVELHQAVQEVDAGAAVVKAGAQIDKTVLNLFA